MARGAGSAADRGTPGDRQADARNRWDPPFRSDATRRPGRGTPSVVARKPRAPPPRRVTAPALATSEERTVRQAGSDAEGPTTKASNRRGS